MENSVLVLIQGKPLNVWIIPGFSMGRMSRAGWFLLGKPSLPASGECRAGLPPPFRMRSPSVGRDGALGGQKPSGQLLQRQEQNVDSVE